MPGELDWVSCTILFRSRQNNASGYRGSVGFDDEQLLEIRERYHWCDNQLCFEV